MPRRTKLLPALALAVSLLAPMAYAVITPLGKITLNETHFEKFGALFFAFRFKVPQTFILCELGVDPAQPTGCMQNLVSDVITVTNNNFGEGVVAMVSDANEQFVLPEDFPLPPPGSPQTAIKETGMAQRLTGKAGLATANPDGSPGPVIRLTATSDLEGASTTSDILVVAAQ